MHPIAITFLALTALTTALWVAAAWPVALGPSFMALRNPALQYTGVLATVAMCVGVWLALRPRWVEGWTGGLDKMYRLHKWLGIAALATSVAHWLISEAPKWAIKLGYVSGRPPRVPRPPAQNVIEQSFRDWRGLSEVVGEWAFYAMAVLVALALIKRFPYRSFRQTHWLLGPIFLAVVFHSVVLLDFKDRASLFGILFAPAMAAASIASLISLFGRVGVGYRVSGEVTRVERFASLGVLASEITIPQG